MAKTSSGRRVKKKKADILFHDDIIIDILSRLPTKGVLRCRVVCKGWRDLTSTLEFKELHLRRNLGLPMILVSNRTTLGDLDHVLLDKWWEPARKRSVFHRFDAESKFPDLLYPKKYQALFSHGGLIVFQYMLDFLICNPASNETVIIKLPRELVLNQICGVYFHPLLKEYCTLWQLFLRGKFCYKMLILGSKPCWREITYPWGHRAKILAVSPVLIGEHLYWLVRSEPENFSSGRADIMAFDVRREKFVLIHCPIPSGLDCVGSQSNLSDIDGVLSFVLISRIDRDKLIQVDIWKLKDGPEQLWVSMNPNTIKVEHSLDCRMSNKEPSATAVVGDMLVVFSHGSFYFWNHKLGTTRTSVKNYKTEAAFCHVMTLASLKNCKSKICMDIDCEVSEESFMAQCLNADLTGSLMTIFVTPS